MSRPPLSRLLFLLAVGLTPLAGWAYLTFVEPRPFFLAQFDAEHLSYYSALILRARTPGVNVSNPGMPAYYLARLVVGLFGDAPGSVEAVLRACRLLAAIITGLVLASVVAGSFRRTPLGLTALAIAPILAWPSFWVFLDYFDPICLQTAVGLLPIACFWRSLEAAGAARRRPWLLACGAALGVSLATKFTFVPLAVAIGAATALRAGRRRDGLLARCREPLEVAAATAVSFGLSVLPVVAEVPRMLLQLSTRHDIRPPHVLRGWRFLAAVHGPVSVLVAGSAALLVALLALNRFAPRATVSADDTADPDGVAFDHQTAGAFLLLMVVAVFYTTAATEASDGGLRNAHASVLSVPFMVLYGFRLAAERHPRLGLRLRARTTQIGLFVLALVVVGTSVRTTMKHRRDYIASHARLVSVTRMALGTLAASNPGPIAVWDDGGLIGEPAFHYWGNYAYGCDYRDPQLIQLDPHLAFFRLREVGRMLRERSHQAGPAGHSPSERTPWLQRTRSRLLATGACPARSDELVSGESAGVRPGLIAFPAGEAGELKEFGEQGLLTLVRSHFGEASVRHESIGGISWVLVALREPGSTSARQTSRSAPADRRKMEAFLDSRQRAE